MRSKIRLIIPAILFLALLGYGGYTLYMNVNQARALVASGTIEATEIHLSTQLGGSITQVYADEGDTVSQGEVLAEIQPVNAGPSGYTEKIRSPLSGVLLERVAEPGEFLTPGGTLLVVADPSTLTLTVYVPEDRIGGVQLGQVYPVTVDSFPGKSFPGRVSYISDQAEFTPRNVQTVEGRKITVFAVRLTLANPDLALKPGMPADVQLGEK